MIALHLRPTTSADEPFVRRLIIRTLEEELAAWSWPEPMRSQLLEMQYRGRVEGLRCTHPEAADQLILQAGHAVGRVVVGSTPAEVRILDITVLAEHRNSGIGTAILTELIEEGIRTARPVRLSVNTSNRAQRLYQRLGFVIIGGSEVQYHLEWTPSLSGDTDPSAPPSFLHPNILTAS